MKKIIVFFTFAFILVFGFAFISHTEVKATGENDGKTVTTVGAAIRTAEPAGLRFAGEVSEAFVGTSVEYGFVITKGTVTKDALLTKLAGSTANKVDAGDLDGQNRFYLSVINIPAKGYDTELTALAYVEVDGAITYADSVVTRSILDVATVEVEDNSNDNAFINRIYNTSTFVLNGGKFVPTTSAVVGAYEAGSAGSSGLTLSPKGNNQSNNWWYRVCLEKTGYDSHLYRVVATYAGGSSAIANKDIPVDYDYILAGYSGSYVTQATNIGNCDYVYISALAAGAEIKASDDFELLLSGNANEAYPINDGATLPNVTKDYYTFNGWYDNSSFTGSVVSTKSTNNAETFYAKYTPINYTLFYDLQGGQSGGSSSLDDVTFTVESSAIVLPLADTMTKEDNTFLGWYDNPSGSGEPITQIAAGSHENRTVYAVWEADVIEDLPLGSLDIATFNAKNIDIIVKSGLSGKYKATGAGLASSYNSIVYNTTGGTAFTSLVDAVTYLNTEGISNKTIYVFTGSYSGDFTVSTANTSIVGPYYNVLGTGSRASGSEANISGIITVGADGFTLRGVKFSGTGKAITWGTTISNLTIENVVSTASGKSTSGGRTAIIASDSAANNIVIRGLKLTCTGTGGRNAIAIYGKVTGFTIENSSLTNGATSNSASEVIRISTIAGVVLVKNNEFEWSTNNMSVFMGSSSNGCSSITFCNNILKGSSTASCTTLGFYRVPKNCETNIVGNYFDYFDSGSTILFSNSVSGGTINIKYNYFGSGVSYNWATVSGVTQTYSNNYYAAAQTTATSDVSAIANLAALITAYKGSGDYTTYGSVCVYEN